MPAGADSNFCLRWNDFESNVSASFRTLRNEQDFFDVTLACDAAQGRTLQAHKVILSACSSFFKQMLKQQQTASSNYSSSGHMPFIYLRGVKYRDMAALLDFMYQGEVNIAQDELPGFLAVAEDLHIKGLTQGSVNKEVASQGAAGGTGGSKRGRGRGAGGAAKRARVSASNVANLDDDMDSGIKNEPLLEAAASAAGTSGDTFVEAGTETFGEGYGDDTTTYTYADETVTTEAIAVETDEPAATGTVDSGADKVTDFNELVTGLLTFENGIHTCNLCGKKSPWRTTMLRHIEANHVETAGHVCDICGNVSKTRHAFNMHKKRMHEKGPDGEPMTTPKKPRNKKGTRAQAQSAAAAAAAAAQAETVAATVEVGGQQVVQQVVITTEDGQQIVQQQQF